MAPTARIRNFEEFLEVHTFLLTASGIPEHLYHQLYQKLSSEIFDSGRFFQIEPCDDARRRRLVLTADHVDKESHVFLIDHAWTFRLADAYKQLQEIPGLVERMASLMCVDVDAGFDSELDSSYEKHNANDSKFHTKEILEHETLKANGSEKAVQWLELDQLEIDDAMLLSLDLSSKFPNLVSLSLQENKLGNEELIVSEATKLKQLKALWLNGNPALETSGSRIAEEILKGCSMLEIYNSHFTPIFGTWALGFCGGIYGNNNPFPLYQNEHPLQSLTSLDLSCRCINNLLTAAFVSEEMPYLSYLNIRGNPLDKNSSLDLLRLLKNFTSLEVLEVDIPGPLGDSAFFIIESLHNLSTLNGVSASKIRDSGTHLVESILQPRLPELVSAEGLIDRVINEMWLYMMTYRLANEDKIDETSVCYVMDELGSALRHSDEPNFNISPFMYMPDGELSSALSFSILWPTQDVQKGEECTRDFLCGFREDQQRSARLTCWFHTPQSYFIQAYEKYCDHLHSRSFSCPRTGSCTTKSLISGDRTSLRVYTDIPHVTECLNRHEFVIAMDPKDADILWTSTQIDDALRNDVGITDKQYINQFPFEACLVMKHHLAETVHEAHGVPKWFQPTYNIETHLSEMIGNYFVHQREGLDNLWILKPWNMARTIDTTITDKLTAIIRLMETGPKVCQKYIEKPCLFKGKKFDLRYLVLVRSMTPLEIFLYDLFWVRPANNKYSLDKSSFFDYETHFTVMNYRGELQCMDTKEFVKDFEHEHQVKWVDIHSKISEMIRSVFEAAAFLHPEMQCAKSRAMYGVDVMLDSLFQPKLLEVTYCPDCTRACTYDMESLTTEVKIYGRDFFNYVFGCLFLDETIHMSQL